MTAVNTEAATYADVLVRDVISVGCAIHQKCIILRQLLCPRPQGAGPIGCNRASSINAGIKGGVRLRSPQSIVPNVPFEPYRVSSRFSSPRAPFVLLLTHVSAP